MKKFLIYFSMFFIGIIEITWGMVQKVDLLDWRNLSLTTGAIVLMRITIILSILIILALLFMNLYIKNEQRIYLTKRIGLLAFCLVFIMFFCTIKFVASSGVQETILEYSWKESKNQWAETKNMIVSDVSKQELWDVLVSESTIERIFDFTEW